MDTFDEEYDRHIQRMRQDEFPMLRSSLYLDHAGTTLYSKSLMDRFHKDMMSHLLGNPHSASTASQRSTQLVENVRTAMLQFFNADPEHFDLVFTANTTAAIKLVLEAFRGREGGFWFGYHADSHTSLLGMRESASSHICFESDEEVDLWLQSDTRDAEKAQLFGYPAQSNMNGRRLPLEWCQQVRRRSDSYTMLDAAAYASTSSMDFSNVHAAADFTVVSFTKMFGFPDLGALIVRRDTTHLFQNRGYFGGGTVDMVVCLKEQWHALKSGSIHERVEDGSLPIHNILALKAALEINKQLFGPRYRTSDHSLSLANMIYEHLAELRHADGTLACVVYKDTKSSYGDAKSQGPIVAFNLLDRKSRYISNAEVEKLASIRDISLRTGGVCNPGGIAKHLRLDPWEMRENFSAGFRCNGENDVLNGKPTGVIRVSFGAMSTKDDVVRFMDFIDEFFVDKTIEENNPPSPMLLTYPREGRFHIESLTVYPIKSCAGWQVPDGRSWPIHEEGLAWDREWCIVHQGTGKALSQKQFPAMALIRPVLDFKTGLLRITTSRCEEELTINLSKDPTKFDSAPFTGRETGVCGDVINTQVYISHAVANFFTKALGVPCTLARFPASTAATSVRHSKVHLQNNERLSGEPRPILLSNESPILTISRSSLNRLNEQIKLRGGKAAHPSVFRANIVLSESPFLPPGQEQPWAEDDWQGMYVRNTEGVRFEFLGGCRRCQMVCIDQTSGVKDQEPFVTLAKTRRFGGRVLFGVHTALGKGVGNGGISIQVGDEVETF